MNLYKLPIIKRLIPSIRKNIRLIFRKHIFWTNIDGVKYLLDIRQKQDREFYFKQEYETENFNFIFKNEFFKKPFVFIDIGSNIGIYTLIIGKKFKNCKKIISFEPILHSFKTLSVNVKVNKIDNITSLLNFALSNEDGITKMGSFSRNRQIQLSKFEINKEGDIDVQTKIFDKLFKFEKEYIFIKCDVEGHEYKIIDGMRNTLQNNSCLLQIEIFNKNYKQTSSILNELNYKKIDIKSQGNVSFFFSKSANTT